MFQLMPRAMLLATALFLTSLGLALAAATYTMNGIDGDPGWLAPGWRFTAESDAAPIGEDLCIEVRPKGDPSNAVRRACTPAGGGNWNCDLFTGAGGIPVPFRNRTIEYQYFIANDSMSSCTASTRGFTGFGASGTAFGNVKGNPDFTTDTSGMPAPLAVRLERFEARPGDGYVELLWETSSEIDNLGFNLLRGSSAEAPDQQINSELILSQAPGSGEGFSYHYADETVVAGESYFYWLEDVDANGVTTRHGPVDVTLRALSPTAVTLTSLSTQESTLPDWLGVAGVVGSALALAAWRRRD